LAAARQINFGDLITQVKPLSAINELITGMRDGSTAGRCMVDLAAVST
jgi:hypothetical protein